MGYVCDGSDHGIPPLYSLEVSQNIIAAKSNPMQSSNPTSSPTKHPTIIHPVTRHPTNTPSKSPTAQPTQKPTRKPTTQRPTIAPTFSPTSKPTNHPIEWANKPNQLQEKSKKSKKSARRNNNDGDDFDDILNNYKAQQYETRGSSISMYALIPEEDCPDTVFELIQELMTQKYDLLLTSRFVDTSSSKVDLFTSYSYVVFQDLLDITTHLISRYAQPSLEFMCSQMTNSVQLIGAMDDEYLNKIYQELYSMYYNATNDHQKLLNQMEIIKNSMSAEPEQINQELSIDVTSGTIDVFLTYLSLSIEALMHATVFQIDGILKNSTDYGRNHKIPKLALHGIYQFIDRLVNKIDLANVELIVGDFAVLCLSPSNVTDKMLKNTHMKYQEFLTSCETLMTVENDFRIAKLIHGWNQKNKGHIIIVGEPVRDNEMLDLNLAALGFDTTSIQKFEAKKILKSEPRKGKSKGKKNDQHTFEFTLYTKDCKQRRLTLNKLMKTGGS